MFHIYALVCVWFQSQGVYAYRISYRYIYEFNSIVHFIYEFNGYFISY